jgi:hypothetical protein
MEKRDKDLSSFIHTSLCRHALQCMDRPPYHPYTSTERELFRAVSSLCYLISGLSVDIDRKIGMGMAQKGVSVLSLF